jgi:hypothetical protein
MGRPGKSRKGSATQAMQVYRQGRANGAAHRDSRMYSIQITRTYVNCAWDVDGDRDVISKLEVGDDRGTK